MLQATDTQREEKPAKQEDHKNTGSLHNAGKNPDSASIGKKENGSKTHNENEKISPGQPNDYNAEEFSTD